MPSFQEESEVPGRIVSEEGYCIDPENIEPILKLKDAMPWTVGEVRQLTGLLGYYRRYIENVSRIAKPIYDFLNNASDTKNFQEKKTRADKQRRGTSQVSSKCPIL